MSEVEPAEATGRSGAWGGVVRPSPRRSLLFGGAGAIVGLLIAGFGLFTAQGTRTFVVPPEDAATVNNIPILRADVIGQLRAVDDVSLDRATGAQKRRVLDDMIREELYVQRGVELGAPNDDIDVRQALVAGAEAVVSQDALTARPAETELKAWYAAHRETYAGEGQMTVGDFLTPATAPAQAERIVTALRRGASPAALRLKPSGRMTGGAEFYFAAKIHLGDRLFAVARTLRDGQVSDAVIQPDGAHFLVMKQNEPPPPTRYEDVHDRVLRDFLNAKVARLQAGNERFLRRRADIKIAPDFR